MPAVELFCSVHTILWNASASATPKMTDLLLEFGDASNSDENDSKDSESEEEDELPKGARVNRMAEK